MTFDPELEAERDGLSHYPVAFLQNLIDNGVVPARRDVAPGAKGSLEYANRLRAERGEPQLVETEDGRIGVATPA